MLRWVVARTERSQEIRAGHPYLGRELLHAHRSNNLADGDLQRNLFVDRSEEKFSGEFWIPKILRQPNIPVLCRVAMLLGLQIIAPEAKPRPMSPRLLVSGYAARSGRW